MSFKILTDKKKHSNLDFIKFTSNESRLDVWNQLFLVLCFWLVFPDLLSSCLLVCWLCSGSKCANWGSCLFSMWSRVRVIVFETDKWCSIILIRAQYLGKSTAPTSSNLAKFEQFKLSKAAWSNGWRNF